MGELEENYTIALNMTTQREIQRVFARGLTFLLLPGTGAAQPERLVAADVASGDIAPRPREIFYMGRAEAVFHKPVEFYDQLRRPFAERGLRFTFFDQLGDLNTTTLSEYDGLFMFGDVQTSGASSELFGRPYVNAIVEFVENGGGLTGLHVASACFRNSTTFGNLLGGRFLGHFPYQEFTANLSTTVSHPIIDGLGTYTSSDEPYQIKDLNPDVLLLGTRDGIGNEPDNRPYTWVRTQGAGKVFYHANGHDASTWNQENFRELMIRGTEWSAEAGSSDSHGALSSAAISQEGSISFSSGVLVGGLPEHGVFSGGFRSILSGRPLFDDSDAGTLATDSGALLMTAGEDKVAISTAITKVGEPGPMAALLVGPSRCPRLVASSGLDCPEAGAGVIYAPVSSFDFDASDSGKVVFLADLVNSTTPLADGAILATNGEITSLLVMEGSPLPSSSAVASDCVSGSLALSEGGLCAMTCLAADGGTEREYLLSDRSGTLEVVLRTGDAVSGLPSGLALAGIDELAIRDDGEILILGRLEGPGVDPTNDTIFCSLPPTGVISVLLREGDSFGEGVLSGDPGPWSFVSTNDRSGCHLHVELDGGGSRAEIVEISAAGARSVVREGAMFPDEGVTREISSFLPESLAISGTELAVQARLDELGTGLDAVLLLGNAVPRILLRSGWEAPSAGSGFVVEELHFRGGAGSDSGLGDGLLVAVVNSAGADSRLVTVTTGDSLDGDAFDDDLEFAFGGEPDSRDNTHPPGLLKVVEGVAPASVELGFWRNLSVPPGNYRIQKSTNLVDWTDLGGMPAAAADQSGVKTGFEKMILTDTLDVSPAYYRIAYSF